MKKNLLRKLPIFVAHIIVLGLYLLWQISTNGMPREVVAVAGLHLAFLYCLGKIKTITDAWIVVAFNLLSVIVGVFAFELTWMQSSIPVLVTFVFFAALAILGSISVIKMKRRGQNESKGFSR